MPGTFITRLACAVAMTLLICVGLAAQPTEAQNEFPCPVNPFDLPAGTACEFALRSEIQPGKNRVCREFTDRNGDPVRTLTAGRGDTLTFTNVATGESLVQKTGGSVTKITPNPDGTETWTNTGHNVVIFFPTDVPAGPSTTLYVGRLVYTVDPNFTFTLQSFTGTSTDICAALSD